MNSPPDRASIVASSILLIVAAGLRRRLDDEAEAIPALRVEVEGRLRTEFADIKRQVRSELLAEQVAPEEIGVVSHGRLHTILLARLRDALEAHTVTRNPPHGNSIINLEAALVALRTLVDELIQEAVTDALRGSVPD